MEPKREYFSRQWDQTDSWAVKTFGEKPQPVSRRLLVREALSRTVGQAAFDALFRKPQAACC